MQIIDLKVCGVQNPTALTESRLYFSYKVRKGENDEKVKVVVASEKARLEAGEYDVWESEEQASTALPVFWYEGKLASDRAYYWQVISPSAKSEIATFSTGLYEEDWTARWVSRKEKSLVAPIFLTPFQAKEGKQVVRAKLYVSGLGYFEAFLNGKRIGEDGFVPQVSDYCDRELNGLFETHPLGTRKSTYYLSYDVKALLQADNTLAVIVGNGWFNNHEKPNEGNFYYGEPRCIYELRIRYADGSEEIIASGKDVVFVGNSRYDRNTLYTGEIVDFRRENKLLFDDYAAGELEACKELRDIGGEFLWQKEPSDRMHEAFSPVVAHESDTHTLYDFKQNHSGVLRLTIKGERGARVKFVFGEEKHEDGTVDVYSSSWGGHIQTDELILSGNEDEYTSAFTIHGYRYCQMEYEKKPQVLAISSEFICSDVAWDGEFSCSEGLFNQIYNNYRYTQLSNLHGNVPTDCPHRERRGFLGDGHASMVAAMYAFDMQLTYRKWIKDIRDAQSITGFMPHTAPFSAGGGGPGFGSGIIIIPYKFYQFYGDKTVLIDGYDGMINWIKYLNTRHNGDYIVVREEKGWCIGEWFNPTLIDLDIPFANTYFFILSIRLVMEICKVIGKEVDLDWLQALYERVCKSFMDRYYDREKHLFCGGGKGAVFFGLDLELLDEEESRLCLDKGIEHIVRDLDYHLETGIFGTPLMMKILSKYGRKDILYKIFSGRTYPGYGYMIERGATTLWEGFEEVNGPIYELRPGLIQGGYGVTHNHPMLGSICEWFFTEIAGLDINLLGVGGEILLKPYIDGEITHASAAKETLYGRVAIAWEKKGSEVEFSVEVPYGCKARLVLPKGCQSALGKGGVLACGKHRFSVTL